MGGDRLIAVANGGKPPGSGHCEESTDREPEALLLNLWREDGEGKPLLSSRNREESRQRLRSFETSEDGEKTHAYRRAFELGEKKIIHRMEEGDRC